jgi:hypothetical protein
MRVARILQQHRELLVAGLVGLLVVAGGCGGGDGVVAPMPVQPAGIGPPPTGPEGKAASNSPRARVKEARAAAKKLE